jgi:hypothetical protein
MLYPVDVVVEEKNKKKEEKNRSVKERTVVKHLNHWQREILPDWDKTYAIILLL